MQQLYALSVLILVGCASLASSMPVFEAVFDKVASGARPLLKSQGVGGDNGTAFDDFADFNLSSTTIIGIHSFNISHGDQIDALQVSYLLSNGSIYHAPVHGNYTTPPVTIKLDSDEYVIKVEGKTNNALADQLTITTRGPAFERRVYGPFGRTGNFSFSFEGYVVGFHGRSGDLLDNVGVYFIEELKKSPEYGGNGGDRFDDRIDGRIPPIIGIYKLHIWAEDIIGAIQAEYIQLGGSLITGELHGNSNSSNLIKATITLEAGEQIIELQGQSGDNFIDRFNITTRKMDGTNAYYGPFGKIGKHPFSFFGNIYGFFGSSGNNIDRLGVYYL